MHRIASYCQQNSNIRFGTTTRTRTRASPRHYPIIFIAYDLLLRFICCLGAIRSLYARRLHGCGLQHGWQCMKNETKSGKAKAVHKPLKKKLMMISFPHLNYAKKQREKMCTLEYAVMKYFFLCSLFCSWFAVDANASIRSIDKQS